MFYHDHIKKLLPTQQFRWENQTLHQKVYLLYYKEEKGEPVYTETEWHQVKVGETTVTGDYACEFNNLREQVAKLQQDMKEFQLIWSDSGVPLTKKRTIYPEIPGWEKYPPKTKNPNADPIKADLKAEIPKGYTLVEFDGGTSCNIPAQGYGEGYGSFKIDDGIVHRVKFGKGHSSNAAEILTIAAALEHLSKRPDASTMKLFIRGDSQIALKWVTCTDKPKAKCSQCFHSAIGILRLHTPKFAELKTEWRGRRYSVKLFGH